MKIFVLFLVFCIWVVRAADPIALPVLKTIKPENTKLAEQRMTNYYSGNQRRRIEGSKTLISTNVPPIKIEIGSTRRAEPGKTNFYTVRITLEKIAEIPPYVSPPPLPTDFPPLPSK